VARERSLKVRCVRRSVVPRSEVRVFGAASRTAVLLSIEPAVASGEWSSPVDQDRPGDLWFGSRPRCDRTPAARWDTRGL